MGKIEKIKIFTRSINKLSLAQVVGLVKRNIKIKKKSSPLLIFTPNLHHLYLIDRFKEVHKAYKKADLIVPDGVFLLWLASLLGISLKGRVNGTDLSYALLELAKKNDFKVFFLSPRKGLGRKIVNSLKEHKIKTDSYDLSFKNYQSSFFTQKALKKINSFFPDILFVGLGAPKQEIWLAKNKEKIKANIALGVGSALDYLVGRKKRAPSWMQKAGLEWFWRFLTEPRRLFFRYFIQDFFFGLKIIIQSFLSKLVPG